MRVALFGATGAIGRHVLDQLLEQDLEVNVIVLDPTKISRKSERLMAVKGDSGDREIVGQAMAGCDAVIHALSVRSNTKAEVVRLLAITQLILSAMKKNGVLRFIGIASAGVEVQGDAKTFGYRLAARFSRLTARHAVEEKQKEFELISGSGLDWTIVRLPFITDGPLTGSYRASLTSPPSSKISHADIALAIVGQLRDRRFVGKAPFIGGWGIKAG